MRNRIECTMTLTRKLCCYGVGSSLICRMVVWITIFGQNVISAEMLEQSQMTTASVHYYSPSLKDPKPVEPFELWLTLD
jgi:hypothetical protein